MRSIAILGCNVYSQITVAHVTLPKAVLNTVKIFAVWLFSGVGWSSLYVFWVYHITFIARHV